MKTVIHTEGLSKEYTRGRAASTGLLRDSLANLFRSPVNSGKEEKFWALRSVSFDLHEGEVLGLIGRNGSGKTTLLKILSRITQPTSGWAEIRGRVGSLLEVGTGFHPELTGRENMYLSGAILGMRRDEITRKFDEIVAFAELEKFIDTPVKHYSSGMYVRLAFAVAAHLEPEILLVDEVLAVGDINFQKKCLGKMGDVARAGRTIILVSHQLNQIRRLCHRVLWIDNALLRQDGPVHEVVSAYESAMANASDGGLRNKRGTATKARFVDWAIAESKGSQSHVLSKLGPVKIRFTVDVCEPVHLGHHGVALYSHDRQLLWGTARSNLKLDVGRHEFCYDFSMLPLRPGPYSWLVSLFDDSQELDMWEAMPEMVVATENYQHAEDRWSGVLNIPSQFSQALVERGADGTN